MNTKIAFLNEFEGFVLNSLRMVSPVRSAEKPFLTLKTHFRYLTGTFFAFITPVSTPLRIPSGSWRFDRAYLG